MHHSSDIIQCIIHISLYRSLAHWQILEMHRTSAVNSFMSDLLSMASLSSDRQHLSYGVCLEVIGEIIRTVLCCIVYDSYAQS